MPQRTLFQISANHQFLKPYSLKSNLSSTIQTNTPRKPYYLIIFLATTVISTGKE